MNDQKDYRLVFYLQIISHRLLLTSKYIWALYYLSSSDVPSIESFECKSCLSSANLKLSSLPLGNNIVFLFAATKTNCASMNYFKLC